ncbi:MAG: YigZ family protein [Christensenellales bacterium]
MLLYKTINDKATVQQVINKSKFIANIHPVQSREEAEDFFDLIRKEHRLATHNVPAMVIGDKLQLQWASDDGEPQGTSGPPILQLLVSERITNVAVIVTRYYGGIKLGTGGLVRAYTSSAKLALEEAGICGVTEMAILYADISYSDHSKITTVLPEWDAEIISENFTDKVRLEVKTDINNLETLKTRLINFTSNDIVFLDYVIRNEKVQLF